MNAILRVHTMDKSKVEMVRDLDCVLNIVPHPYNTYYLAIGRLGTAEDNLAQTIRAAIPGVQIKSVMEDLYDET